MDVNQVLTGSGLTAIIIALAYGVKMLIDWQRATSDVSMSRTTAGVMSAETANAVILKSLEAMENENGRLRQRVIDLEASEAAKDQKIDELQVQVRGFQAQLEQVQTELTALKSGN